MNEIALKVCRECNLELEFDNFTKNKSHEFGLCAYCKSCVKIKSNKYYSENRLEQIGRSRAWITKNPEKIKIFRAKYEEKPYNKMKTKYSRRLHHLVAERKEGLDDFDPLIGCSINEYKKYLQSLFISDMSWDNYGKVWVIDHIKPLRLFNLFDYEDVKRAYFYLNSQPLTWTENSQKLDKLADGTLARHLV